VNAADTLNRRSVQESFVPNLDPMLGARSVAVVGASERAGSVGDHLMRQLVECGFTGDVYPVNPRYDTLHGLSCVPSLSDVGPVDHAVLAVANAHLESALQQAVAAGARSATIFASCHGVASDGTLLRERLRHLAGDLPICGGNGMGFLNLENRLRICGFYQPYDLEPGGVSFISHSGSLFSAMLHNRRLVRFNLVVSTGLELNTSMDAYMSWVLDLESTKVLALFLETIRDAAGFREALRTAEARDVPVVALKVGSSEGGRRAVATHSEAIAGDDAAYEALFAAHGVHRVRSMNELLDTVELFAAGRRATAAGLGAVHDSGGERALLVDTADRVGVPLPGVGAQATTKLAAVLDPGLEPANPVDAWGTGRDAEDVFTECLIAMAGDEDIGAVTFCVDLTTEERGEDAYAAAVLRVVEATAKPAFVLANVSAAVDAEQARVLRSGGVPVLEGTETGLLAVRHLFAHLDHASLPAMADRVTSPRDVVVDGGEFAALDLLAGYGIATPRRGLAAGPAEAVAVAERVGYPVTVKTAVPGLGHKSDVGGVVLGLADAEDVGRVYREMADRLGPEVLVAEMAAPGIEVAFGMVNDPQFGPVVIVSAGGVLIDTVSGRLALLPRIDSSRARRIVDRLSVRPLLEGTRGSGPYDVYALVAALVRFSELAADAGPSVAAIDVNPVIVHRDGCTAVDALMVTT
jgi:acyl-CoA synthetase (NDP forming)